MSSNVALMISTPSFTFTRPLSDNNLIILPQSDLLLLTSTTAPSRKSFKFLTLVEYNPNGSR